MKRTKIVATISDKRCEVVFLRELFEAGMNVVRLNTAHMMEEGLKPCCYKCTRSIRPHRYIDGYQRPGSTYHYGKRANTFYNRRHR